MARTTQNILESFRQNRRLIFADDYELCVREVHSNESTFRGGECQARALRDSVWVGLRVMHRKQPGRASVTCDSPEALDALVDLAFESSTLASTDPWFRFPLWRPLTKTAAAAPRESRPGALTNVEGIDELHIDRHESWGLVRKTEKQIREHVRTVKTRALKTAITHPFGLTAIDENRVLRDSTVPWSDGFIERVAGRNGGVEFVPRGQTHFIFTPGAASVFLNGISHWFCADRILLDESPLVEKIGQLVFPTAISITDDGTLADGVRTLPFDLEGVSTQKKKLVEAGQLKDLLHNAYTATRENRLSTGNQLWMDEMRGPSLTHSTLFVEPGTESPQGWISAMREGIVLDVIERFEPSLVPGGQWELFGHGWAIMRGEKVTPVWNIRLRFDPLRFWSHAASVGNDLDFFGTTGCPSIFFENIPLG